MRIARYASALIIFLLVSGLLLAQGIVMAEPGQAPSQAELKKIVQRFEAYAEGQCKKWGVPGMAIAVVAGDKVVSVKGLGSTALSGGTPVDQDTIFQIGSASKSFTATLLAMMADQGKLAWDDPVIKHYPAFLMKDPWVTRQFLIKDLLAQHTGLPPHCGEDQAFFGFTAQQMIESLRYMQPVTSFRAAYAYQNIPHLVASAIVSRYTGKDFGANLKEMIFEPLGMHRASLPKSGLASGNNVTRLHLRQGGKTVMMPKDWLFQDWIYTYGPAGGINASIMDMTQWLRLQINRGQVDGKRLVSAKNLDFVHTPATLMNANLADNSAVFYCQGWSYARADRPYALVWHNGDTTVNHAMMAYMPMKKAGVVMLSNLGGVDLLDALARYFCDVYCGVTPPDYCGKIYKQMLAQEKEAAIPSRPKGALPPQPLERYAGTYQNPIYGKVSIAPRTDGLVLTIGPKKVRVQLKPWDRDLFMGLSVLDPNQAMYQVSFGMDAAGRVSHFVIDELKYEAGGLFQRAE